jgi:hypothetical protein
MLFPEEDTPLLKKWIMQRLADTCVTPSAMTLLNVAETRLGRMLTQMYLPIMFSRC